MQESINDVYVVSRTSFDGFFLFGGGGGGGGGGIII